MKNIHRSTLPALPAFLAAALLAAACGSPPPAKDDRYKDVAIEVKTAPTPAPVPPPSFTLEAYKAEVARHIMRSHPDRVYVGRLPPMLPAVVVLNITVDRDGGVQDVQVQRSRDRAASHLALDTVRRSGPLPKPEGLVDQHPFAVTFSETFLFAEPQRFQIRTLAEAQ